MDISQCQRVMAHSITYAGKRHNLAIATLTTDRKSVDIKPFECEIASTTFVNGEIAIESGPDGCLHFVKKD